MGSSLASLNIQCHRKIYNQKGPIIMRTTQRDVSCGVLASGLDLCSIRVQGIAFRYLFFVVVRPGPRVNGVWFHIKGSNRMVLGRVRHGQRIRTVLSPYSKSIAHSIDAGWNDTGRNPQRFKT